MDETSQDSSPTPPSPITRAIEEMKEGTPGAKDKVFRLLYAELHGLAQKQLQGENPGHTLQPTALVHEAYLRLVRAEGGHFEDRRHFMRTAARAMRSILVDFARKKTRPSAAAGAPRSR